MSLKRDPACPVWAVTSYFNPLGYKNRLVNYRLFRQSLNVPLVAIEASQTGSFELRFEDAELLIRRSYTDLLWQKERLLNEALRRIPPECEIVAWLDCDVLLEEDWSDQTYRLLQRYSIIKLFASVCDVAPTFLVSSPTVHEPLVLDTSLLADAREHPRPTPELEVGFAWAAPRALLEQHGFYDVCVVGGGDGAMAFAASGDFEVAISDLHMNDKQKAHYLNWARPFCASTQGKVGTLESTLFHLWHGTRENRKYGERHQGIKRFDFDPTQDIAVDENGCWRWSSDKPDLHQYVKDYFVSRKEDRN